MRRELPGESWRLDAARAGTQGGEAAAEEEGGDGGAMQQRDRETAEEQARRAAQTGDAYVELIAQGVQYASKDDHRKEAMAFREAIALRPDRPSR